MACPKLHTKIGTLSTVVFTSAVSKARGYRARYLTIKVKAITLSAVVRIVGGTASSRLSSGMQFRNVAPHERLRRSGRLRLDPALGGHFY